ncbi:ketoacyl-ACP synthase III [soil metagenome]
MATRIKSISYYLPAEIYSNEDFYKDFPDAKQANLEKVGVEKRHIAGKTELASDLAITAAEKLFEEHNIDRSIIDFLFVSILEHDFYAPTSGCYIHGKLGLKKKCGVIDFDLGCSAYVYGLGLSDGVMHSMGAKNVLLLTVSVLTKKFHSKDRSSRFVFGDAASATLMTSSETENIGPFVFGTDGSGYEKIIVRDGAARFPLNSTSNAELKDEFGNITTTSNLVMDGMGVFLFSIRTVPPMIEELLTKAGLQQNEIDLFIFHQPNVFLNETLRKKINIPEDKFVHCMKDFGNTVQSTIPIAIYESMKSGKLKPGMKVVLAGFGSGFSWAATIVRF